MKFHTQQHLVIRDETGTITQNGSCYPTVYACILDLELDQVPYFHLLYFSNPTVKKNLSKFFQNRYLNGKTIDDFDGPEYCKDNFHRNASISLGLWDMVREMWLASQGFKEEFIENEEIEGWLKNNPGVPYIASGDSSRGVSHVVIYQDGKMIHDPHPSREGLIKLKKDYAFSYLKKIE